MSRKLKMKNMYAVINNEGTSQNEERTEISSDEMLNKILAPKFPLWYSKNNDVTFRDYSSQ